MNDMLLLKGKLEMKGKMNKMGPPSLPKGSSVDTEKIKRLSGELRSAYSFWQNNRLGIKPLVKTVYTRIVAKSNRNTILLLDNSSKNINSQVVGAEFIEEEKKKHCITYSVSLEAIEESIDLLDACADIVSSYFSSLMSAETLDAVNKGKKSLHGKMSKTKFASVIRDAFYTEHFAYENKRDAKINASQLVSIYNTGLSANELIARIGNGFSAIDTLDDVTWLLTPKQYEILKRNASFLIAMAVPDLSIYCPETSKESMPLPFSRRYIDPPKDEPVIGVIDTLFDDSVYFSSWVDYHQVLEGEFTDKEDYIHGTEVTSIIVDGPSLNPALDDGCGRFRVRHFGIATYRPLSSVYIMKNIERIVEENPDIKVWNLSLGSSNPISMNSISPEASILDRLQYEHDCLFVVSGTNAPDNQNGTFPPIGAPADSINSIIVNAVDFSSSPASYSRRGPALSFFTKPDLSAFGGTTEDPIMVYSPRGIEKKRGTSFACPWIARKAAYLIYVMGLSRESAKALLIDSAAGWNTDIKNITLKGYGAVPVKIDKILQTPNDEIRFILEGNVLDWETYNMRLPIPFRKEGFPYRVRFTLAYFPRCSRNQGVDYTDTELDVHFGRLKKDGIKSINNNEQGEPYFIDLSEELARKLFRKWDNVKHVTEGLNNRAKVKGFLSDNHNWGFSIHSIERGIEKPGRGMRFALIVTLRDMDGYNRIEQFIKNCHIDNVWTVIRLNQQVMVETFAEAQTEIEFES